ncbi:MAG: mechanosensitive ion channel family protein, partial [Gammaproteobacteria bacterium]
LEVPPLDDDAAAELLRTRFPVLGAQVRQRVLTASQGNPLALLELPSPWDVRVRHLWFIGIGIQIALYLHRAVGVGVMRYFRVHASHHGSSADSVAHTLLVWAVQSTVWISLLLAVLANLGINVSTFVASLGIGGIAVALAVQNILGDLFASLSIAVDKPFEVGDAISVQGFSGTVERVGLKTTRIRSDSGEQIVIANSELLKDTVRNFKRMSQRRVQFALRIDPTTPPQVAESIPARLQQIVAAQDKVRFERAHLKSVDQQSMEFELVYYVLDPGFGLYMDKQQAVLFGVLNALAELKVSTSLAPQPVQLRASPDLPAPQPDPEPERRRPFRSIGKGGSA